MEIWTFWRWKKSIPQVKALPVYLCLPVCASCLAGEQISQSAALLSLVFCSLTFSAAAWRLSLVLEMLWFWCCLFAGHEAGVLSDIVHHVLTSVHAQGCFIIFSPRLIISLLQIILSTWCSFFVLSWTNKQRAKQKYQMEKYGKYNKGGS